MLGLGAGRWGSGAGVCEARVMKIGVLGGTGPAGRGIAARLAAAGHDVVVGSRDRERARSVVDDLREQWGERVAGLEPGTNHDAADADLVVLATVWDAAVRTAQAHAEQLAGKIVISMANGLVKRRPPVRPRGVARWLDRRRGPGRRARCARRRRVPPRPRGRARRPRPPRSPSDVLVVGDDDAPAPIVLDLIDGIPDLRALDAGSLENAVGIETFAAALLTVNLRHKGEGSLRIDGIGPRRTRTP